MNMIKPSTLAMIAKLFVMAIVDSLLVWMIYVALLGSDFLVGGVLVAILIAANWVYFSKRTVAAKFLFPGTVLLVILVVVPIIYTAWMSTFNYKTGNQVSKDAAVAQLKLVGLVPDASGATYDLKAGSSGSGHALLLTDQATHEVFLGTSAGLKPLAAGTYKLNSLNVAVSADGFTPLKGKDLVAATEWISSFEVPSINGRYVLAQGLDIAALMHEKFVFSKDLLTLKDTLSGVTYKDNGNGNYVDVSNKDNILFPGWQSFNPAQNYVGLITNPKLSGPFFRVFVWTIAFAFITVAMMWALGFVLALAMDKKIRLRGFYRAVLILPYAMPSFMSILIWAGIFNQNNGALNNLLGGVHIGWLTDPWLARGAILLVNLWLGFPYFYLISTGALQALPSDIEEAAEIDGATGSQIFWQIKLPLVFQILSPLLISSVAFNFNNFNLIYLLTHGGPTDVLNGETAGATDLLITYAYKTAFGSNEQNLGLACSISVLMFVIVGALSMWSLRRSKVLEEM